MATSTQTANGAAGGTRSGLTVGPLGPGEHAEAAFRFGASFLQTPQWAAVKPDWTAESLGWRTADGDLVGSALVLHRRLPGSGGRTLAYLPEGPSLPWADVASAPADWLDPLLAHLRSRRAFAVRMGPLVPLYRWRAGTAKRGLADPATSRLADLTADVEDATGTALVTALRATGWTQLGGGEGFTAGQPDHVVQIPLLGRTVDDLRAGMNQEWRRNLRRAAQAGVVVRRGDAADLETFHALYAETAGRDHFTPRPRSYFTRMWRAFHPESDGTGDAGPAGTSAGGPAEAPTGSPVGGRPELRLYLAELDGEALAAATVVTLARHAWYGYGASTSRRRDARASNAVQWQALQDAVADGCHVYDLRGIGSTLDPGSPLAGLLRFKLGTGGEVVRYVGEWELSLSRTWHTAFRTGMAAQSRVRAMRKRTAGRATGGTTPASGTQAPSTGGES